MQQSDCDIALMRLFWRGYPEPVDYLYATYFTALAYFAYRLIHNREEAEDIAQESMIKLLNKKQKFHTLSDIKSYLYVTTRNACFDYLNDKVRHARSHQEILYLSAQREEAADF
jgi:RNA polymerase sigma factor (sigma-70 family)